MTKIEATVTLFATFLGGAIGYLEPCSRWNATYRTSGSRKSAHFLTNGSRASSIQGCDSMLASISCRGTSWVKLTLVASHRKDAANEFNALVSESILVCSRPVCQAVQDLHLQVARLKAASPDQIAEIAVAVSGARVELKSATASELGVPRQA